VRGQRVVLHRIGRQVQGPIDSTVTDARGRFSFRFVADTAALYLLSARYAGVEYFSSPIHLNTTLPDTAIALVVSDTSSAEPVALSGRYLAVSRPQPDGTRRVLDVATLVNAGERTRVPRDTIEPSWFLRLPSGVLDPRPGEGDFSPESVVFRGDSLLLFAPIAPGQKQISISYTLPARIRQLAIRLEGTVRDFAVLLEEPGATLTGPSATMVDTQTVGGRHFRRWTAAVSQPADLRIRVPTDWLGTWLLPLGVVAVGATLALVTWVALRPRRTVVPGPAEPDLVDAIARLDARYAGREDQVPAEEWEGYRIERERLKARLADRLAPRRPPS
jgi:hypothetical protein